MFYGISTAIFDVLTGLALVGCAFFLTRNIRTLIGKKANTCLLGWHVLNLVISACFYQYWYYEYNDLDKAAENDDGSACSELSFVKAEI